MWLHRVHLNPRCREVRRDLADPYQMHASLSRAFCPPEQKCPPGAILWRLEPETDRTGLPRVLIQSKLTPDWSRTVAPDWLARADPGIDMAQKLGLATLVAGQRLRFRLCANPCRTVAGKRQGLMMRDEQITWLERKAEQHGFALCVPATMDYFDFMTQPSGREYPDCRVTHQQMLRGRQHGGNTIRVFAALFEGQLSVTVPDLFRSALVKGVGHAKMMGLGLLSVVPVAD